MPAAVVDRRILGHGGRNWITQTKGVSDSMVGNQGALPKFLAFVASGILKGGGAGSVGEAIELAIGALRGWASGKGHVTEITRKRSAAALAEWEAKRAETAKRAVSADSVMNLVTSARCHRAARA